MTVEGQGEGMSKAQTISERIRVFVLGKFPLARKRGVKDADLLLENGIVDSMGVLDLVTFLENEFGIQVSDEELIPENFRSIEQIADFVNAKSPAVQGHAAEEFPDLKSELRQPGSGS